MGIGGGLEFVVGSVVGLELVGSVVVDSVLVVGNVLEVVRSEIEHHVEHSFVVVGNGQLVVVDNGRLVVGIEQLVVRSEHQKLCGMQRYLVEQSLVVEQLVGGIS